jgi:hypothetical protein
MQIHAGFFCRLMTKTIGQSASADLTELDDEFPAGLE